MLFGFECHQCYTPVSRRGAGGMLTFIALAHNPNATQLLRLVVKSERSQAITKIWCCGCGVGNGAMKIAPLTSWMLLWPALKYCDHLQFEEPHYIQHSTLAFHDHGICRIFDKFFQFSVHFFGTILHFLMELERTYGNHNEFGRSSNGRCANARAVFNPAGWFSSPIGETC